MTDQKQKCIHTDQININKDAQPTGHGCEECMKTGDTWVELRMCLTCGHIGCCDSSKSKHATKHFHDTGHAVMQAFQSHDPWRWCYIDEAYV